MGRYVPSRRFENYPQYGQRIYSTINRSPSQGKSYIIVLCYLPKLNPFSSVKVSSQDFVFLRLRYTHSIPTVTFSPHSTLWSVLLRHHDCIPLYCHTRKAQVTRTPDHHRVHLSYSLRTFYLPVAVIRGLLLLNRLFKEIFC